MASVTAVTTQTSPAETPRMEPKRTASTLLWATPKKPNRTRPLAEAHDVVVAGVRPVEDDSHAGVLDDVHGGAVGPFEHLGGEHRRRRSDPGDPGVEADQMGEMGRHPVQIVGGEHDGQTLGVE